MKDAKQAEAIAKDFVKRTRIWTQQLIRNEGELILIAATIKKNLGQTKAQDSARTHQSNVNEEKQFSCKGRLEVLELQNEIAEEVNEDLVENEEE